MIFIIDIPVPDMGSNSTTDGQHMRIIPLLVVVLVLLSSRGKKLQVAFRDNVAGRHHLASGDGECDSVRQPRVNTSEPPQEIMKQMYAFHLLEEILKCK